ncbi:MAG: OmpL47-type beta-barrel domain-containing protein [Nocardioidaceae bacterium]
MPRVLSRAMATTIVLAACVLLVPAAAQAAWLQTGSGQFAASAGSVLTPAAPSVSRAGSSVTVSWPAVTRADGATVSGYVLRRYASDGGSTMVCSTAALQCAEPAPVTDVSYAVTATYGPWSSAVGPRTPFTPDIVAPVSTLSTAPVANANGWIVATNPTVTVSATDSGTGVASITYTVGSGSPVTVPGSIATFAVGQGSTVVTYAATDVAGNVEATKAVTLNVDGQAPVVRITAPANGQAYDNKPGTGTGSWSQTCAPSPGACGTATDSASGVASIRYELRNTGVGTCWNGKTGTKGNNASAFATAFCGTGLSAKVAPTWSIAIPYSVFAGVPTSLQLTVVVTDQAGNSTSAVSRFSVS